MAVYEGKIPAIGYMEYEYRDSDTAIGCGILPDNSAVDMDREQTTNWWHMKSPWLMASTSHDSHSTHPTAPAPALGGQTIGSRRSIDTVIKNHCRIERQTFV